jgi:hypothetical protein
MNDFIETDSLPVSYRIPAEDTDLDPRYVKTLEVTYNVIEMLTELRNANASGQPVPDSIDQDYVDELEAAFHAGERVLYHDRREEIATDMSACDPDLLRELRATMVYVAPHFNVDLELPAPDSDTETEGTTE